jgi:hypothetical protein
LDTCDEPVTGRGRWCADHVMIDVVCDGCGKTFQRRRSLYNKQARRYPRSFCDRTCLGRFIGLNYGFGVKAVVLVEA